MSEIERQDLRDSGGLTNGNEPGVVNLFPQNNGR